MCEPSRWLLVHQCTFTKEQACSERLSLWQAQYCLLRRVCLIWSVCAYQRICRVETSSFPSLPFFRNSEYSQYINSRWDSLWACISAILVCVWQSKALSDNIKHKVEIWRYKVYARLQQYTVYSIHSEICQPFTVYTSLTGVCQGQGSILGGPSFSPQHQISLPK